MSSADIEAGCGVVVLVFIFVMVISGILHWLGVIP